MPSAERSLENLRVALPHASVSPDRRYRPDASVVEAQLFWERELQAVRHVTLGEELRLEDLNLELPTELDLLVARRDGERSPFFVLPNGVVVPEGNRMSLRIGRLTLRLAFVVDDTPALPRVPLDPRVRLGVLAGVAVHLVFVSFFAFSPPEVVEHASAPFVSIRRTFVSPQALGLVDSTSEETESTAPAIGEPVAVEDRPAPVTVTTAAAPKALDSAANFGMLALLARQPPRARSPFARETKTTRAVFDGAAEALAVGGLELSGIGEAGGARAPVCLWRTGSDEVTRRSIVVGRRAESLQIAIEVEELRLVELAHPKHEGRLLLLHVRDPRAHYRNMQRVLDVCLEVE
ncbi:hypothetical protein [Labilithrix luteola]|uniref:hypothetical protein n=1 Tax=Labilithrix luteola TaxID=1391654 RepID=UPI0011BAAE6F|nr:hypothetical protein [Labilithrix luteola]